MGGLSFFPIMNWWFTESIYVMYIYIFFFKKCVRGYPWQHDNYCIFSFVYVITVI